MNAGPDFFEGEEWRPVVGFEDSYEVSSYGRVRSLDREWEQKNRWGGTYTHRKKGVMLRPGIASNDYPTVALGRGNTRTLHSLVADAFIGPCPAGEEVRHKDDNRRNPMLDNLEYGTRGDNVQDMWDRNPGKREKFEAMPRDWHGRLQSNG